MIAVVQVRYQGSLALRCRCSKLQLAARESRCSEYGVTDVTRFREAVRVEKL